MAVYQTTCAEHKTGPVWLTVTFSVRYAIPRSHCRAVRGEAWGARCPGARTLRANEGGTMHPQLRVARMTAVVLAVAAVLIAVGGAQANVTLTPVSADRFTNATSQHATEVEPDTFANGKTVVAAFQVGRFFNGGGSDIGFVRSGDGGATWGAPGFLPGMTFS